MTLGDDRIEVADDVIEWCRSMFYSLKVGGVWGVPRSGLVFTRTADNVLTLTEQLERTDHMSGSDRLLWREYQQADYIDIAEHFRASGIEVAIDDSILMRGFGIGAPTIEKGENT